MELYEKIAKVLTDPKRLALLDALRPRDTRERAAQLAPVRIGGRLSQTKPSFWGA